MGMCIHWGCHRKLTASLLTSVHKTPGIAGAPARAFHMQVPAGDWSEAPVWSPCHPFSCMGKRGPSKQDRLIVLQLLFGRGRAMCNSVLPVSLFWSNSLLYTLAQMSNVSFATGVLRP